MGRDTSKKTEARVVDLEDLRDDTIAVVLNSGYSFERVHREGGPTAQTLRKWLYRETRYPRLDSVRSTLQACGYDFFVLPQTVMNSERNGGNPEIKSLRPSTTQKLPLRERMKAKRAAKGVGLKKNRRAASV